MGLKHIIVACTLLAPSGLAYAQKLSQLPEERAVVQAALKERGLDTADRLIIADRTATYDCKLTPDDLVQVEGCSGMSRRGEPLEEVMARLKRTLAAGDDTLADFRMKNAKAIVVDKPFEIHAPQLIWGPGRGIRRSQLADPDYSVIVSRVGFDKAKRQALVYVGTISGSNPKQSFGEYVLMNRSGAAWKVGKRFRVWQLG